MQKRDHWDRHLMAWADRVNGQPYRLGHTDCASLAFGAIGAMCGQDAESALRRTVRAYSSPLGALRAHKECGGAWAVLLRAGLERRDVRFMQRGDIVLVPSESSALPEVSVCLGSRLLVAHEPTGTHIVRITRALLDGAICYRVVA